MWYLSHRDLPSKRIKGFLGCDLFMYNRCTVVAFIYLQTIISNEWVKNYGKCMVNGSLHSICLVEVEGIGCGGERG